ncbi:late secretory pathway protein avl9 [Mactra antiquata]
MASLLSGSTKPVLHVVVIGFHHKKGCQVEYAYPPLIEGGEVNSHEAPVEWKNLPSLAVPDGAHNFVKDTIYFHLPAREDTHKTVYGVACYRQINAAELKIKTDDITRSTVQKSVCVLSNLPLYGLIQAKLELITHAYFQELDFSRVSLLEETYNNLNASLTESLLDGGSQVYLGMNIKDLVIAFRHKIVVLFKLILLERRVLFTGSPVESLGNAMLSVLSLYPGMIEYGLVESTTYGVHKQISPTITSTNIGDNTEDFLEIRYSEDSRPEVDQYFSNEPESPTMDRGERLFNIKNSTTSFSQDANDSSKPCKDTLTEDTQVTNSENGKCANFDYNDIDPSLQYVDDYYTKEVKVNTQTSNVDNKTSVDNVNGSKRQLVLAEDSDMLVGVTQYEAVQAGKSIPKKGSVINIEECSLDIHDDYFLSTSPLEGSKTVPETESSSSSTKVGEDKALKKKKSSEDSVEELDSPESISQIDQEDCFSWEDDKLSLAIDTDKNELKLDDTAGLVSSFKEISMLERLQVSNLDVNNQSDTVDDEVGNHSNHTTSNTNTPVDDEVSNTPTSPAVKAASIRNKLSNAFSGISLKGKLRNKTLSREASQTSTTGSLDESVQHSNTGSQENSTPSTPVKTSDSFPMLPVLNQDDYGFPLPIFTKGCVCFPYLSLQYFDLLNDVNIRSFLIGATNMLFRHKRHLTDVLVDVDESKIEIHDKELQKVLVLTTADLRFADILVKAVTGVTDDGYFDDTEWEGNDEWLRAQFRVYLEGLLAAITSEDPKLSEDYGNAFVQCWKTTHSYKVWSSSSHPGFQNVQAGHPCQGHLSMTDIKVRLSHTMHNTEGGKKINAAVSSTGKYVVQTGKAVGGAITQAKSSLSSWFSTLTNDWKSTNEKQ